jgi:hypothetical protein
MVHFYEIVMQSYTRTDVKSPSTTDFPSMLQCFQRLAARKPVEIARTQNVSTVLADWNYDPANNFYELLINKADATLSDVAFRNLSTKALRKAGKQKIEGIETSCHILLKPDANGHSVTVLMTMGAGISIADVATLFRNLAKAASGLPANHALFHFDHPSGAKAADGTPVQYRVSYKFTDYAYKGQTLVQALQTGEFESLELIAHDVSQFDTGGNLQIEERVVKVKAALPKTVTGAALRNAIDHFKRGPDGAWFDTARIHYKSPSGKSSATTLQIQALDATFTHNERIEFDTDVEAQQASLSPTVLQKMRPLLLALP